MYEMPLVHSFHTSGRGFHTFLEKKQDSFELNAEL